MKQNNYNNKSIEGSEFLNKSLESARQMLEQGQVNLNLINSCLTGIKNIISSDGTDENKKDIEELEKAVKTNNFDLIVKLRDKYANKK